MKQLIDGKELLSFVPSHTSTGKGPVVRLAHGLTLDDGNCWSSPTLIQGAVGTGKSTFMKGCMTPILDYAQEAEDNVIIFSAKPELLAYARPKDTVISITNLAPHCCWNLFREAEASDHPHLTLRELSISLFRNAEEKTNQIFFPQAARDLFYGAACKLYDYGKSHNLPVSNADLVEFLTTTPIWGDEDTPGWLNLADLEPRYFAAARDYIGNGTDQGLGVLSELRTLIGSVFYESFAENGTFSAIEALKAGGNRIFLHFDYANSGRSTLTVYHILLDLLLKQSMSSHSQHKTWFFFDEASLLPKSDVLTDALSFARDPGSNGKGGVRIIMALQSAQLICRQYTELEGKTLLSLFPNVISFRVSDPMSRSVLADRYGKSHYMYSVPGGNDQLHCFDSYENVLSDYHFSVITKKGQAIMSLPGISDSPFIYDGYQKGLDRQ